MQVNEECNIVANNYLKYKNNYVFKIGHHYSSCTKSPGFYFHDGIYFLDCPGVED